MSPCEHSQSHYSGCECHESAWIARLNAERNDLLECRLANTWLQASVAELKAQLAEREDAHNLKWGCRDEIAALKAQLATTSKGSLSVEALQEKLGIAIDVLEEMVEIITMIRHGEYQPDSFTCQPAQIALAQIKPFSHMLPVILSEGEKLKDGQTGPR